MNDKETENKIEIRSLKMNFHEQLNLSPIQQYYKFGRFPWRFIVHIFLVAFTTYQIISLIELRVSHTRSQHIALKKILFDIDDQKNSKQLYKLQEFQESFKSITDGLLSLDSKMMRQVQIENAHFEMIVYYKQFNITGINQNTINISQEDLKNGIKYPFDISNDDSVRKFINNVNRVDLVAHNITTYADYTDKENSRQCYKWRISVNYEFQQYANFVTTLETDIYLCKNDNQFTALTNYAFIHGVVIFLACVSFGLCCKYLIDVSKMFINQKIQYENAKQQIMLLQKMQDKQSIDLLRQQYQYLINQRLNNENNQNNQQTNDILLNKLISNDKKYEDVEEGTFKKVKNVNLWIIINMLGNIIQVVGSILALIDNNTKNSSTLFRYREPIIGTGCVISLIVMLNYLSYYRGINLMASTISRASSNIFLFFLGVMPLFCAFVFLAQCIFWKYDKFQDTPTTIMTLFCLSNGDSVNDVFLSTTYEGFLSQVFIIVFMIIFFTAVQNVFITIVMDGYESYKQDKHKHYKLDENQEYQKEDCYDNHQEEKQLEEEMQNEYNNDKDIVIGKLKINKKRVKNILKDLEGLYEKVRLSKDMKINDQKYLEKVFNDNIQNLNRNLKFQLDSFTFAR